MVYIHRAFSYESTGERILKIGPSLPKLLTNKWHTFWRHTVHTYYRTSADKAEVMIVLSVKVRGFI